MPEPDKIEKLRDTFVKYPEKGSDVFPRIIHVETRSKCNSLCGFCPASVKTDKRQDVFMADELLLRIINDLQEVDYSNRLSFYNNNEPFLDERIFKIISLARQRLPKAYLELKSNGLILNSEKIIDIFSSGLDMLYINDYSKDGRYHENVQKIKDDLSKMRRFKGHFENGLYYSRVIISLGSIDDVKGSRAGNSPNKKFHGRALHRMCLRPFEMMAIEPAGRVSVCSEDFYHKIFMGDVSRQKLFDIWRSDKWNDFRKELVAGNRAFDQTCSACDYRGYTLEILRENGLFKPETGLNIKKTISKLLGFNKK